MKTGLTCRQGSVGFSLLSQVKRHQQGGLGASSTRLLLLLETKVQREKVHGCRRLWRGGGHWPWSRGWSSHLEIPQAESPRLVRHP